MAAILGFKNRERSGRQARRGAPRGGRARGGGPGAPQPRTPVTAMLDINASSAISFVTNTPGTSVTLSYDATNHSYTISDIGETIHLASNLSTLVVTGDDTNTVTVTESGESLFSTLVFDESVSP